MAKVSIATGNWSTAATWGTITNTPTIHASTNLTLTTGNNFTATFTAPNTTDQCLGALLYVNAQGTTTINVTLQESTVDTAATVAVAFTNGAVTTAAGWYFFRFATPYTFTTVAAGAYRFRVTLTSNTTAATVAADSGGTLIAFQAVDGRTAVPGAETAYVVGSNNGTNVTVTMEGTRTVGAGTDTATLTSTAQRSVGLGLAVSQNGILTWDTVADSLLTILGHGSVSASGIWRIGTTGTPMPSGVTARLRFNQNGVAGNYGLQCSATGTLSLQGLNKGVVKTNYVSGLGTAASPLVVSAATTWAVGDQITISGGVYNEYETRFIITVNSSTSFVLSNTAGGAENALANTHTTNHIICNITRNVIIDTNSTTQGMYTYIGPITDNLSDWDWVRFENTGVAAIASKQGIFIASLSVSGASLTYGSADNCVVFNPIYCGFAVINSSTTKTHDGLMVINGTSTTAPGTGGGTAILANAANKTFTNCYTIGMGISGIFIATAPNISFTSCEWWNCNSGNSAQAGGISLAGPTAPTFTNCSIQGNRLLGILVNSTTLPTFTSLHCGDYATNTTDISCASGGTNVNVHFEMPTFGSATLISGYTGQGTGSKITMQTINANTSDHRTYEPGGTTRSSGTGLADTNVRTSGSLAWRIAPENNTTGLVKEFLILAKANSAVFVTGFIQKNAAFGSSVCRVDLYLPDAPTVVAATQTMGNDTNFNVFSLAANYTGDEDRYAVVRITAITATASAYVYVDDIYNGTNEITALDVFYKGEPGPIMFEQLGDAAAVWGVLTSTLTTSGTTGYLLTKLLKLATFVGLK